MGNVRFWSTDASPSEQTYKTFKSNVVVLYRVLVQGCLQKDQCASWRNIALPDAPELGTGFFVASRQVAVTVVTTNFK
jgi:hypothetical protein